MNQQSEAGARQVRRNTNLFVIYVQARPLALDRQTTSATESVTTSITNHTAYTYPKSFFGEKKHQSIGYWDECMPLTGFFRGYCLLTTTFAWRSLTFFFFYRKYDYFSPFILSKTYSPFFGTPP